MKNNKIINIIKNNIGYILTLIIITISLILYCNYVSQTNEKITQEKNEQVERWNG